MKSLNWSKEEDDFLTQNKSLKWRIVSICLNDKFHTNRSAAQCSQRWTRVLNPKIRREKWETEEDHRLLRAIISCEPKRWNQIAAKMPGRTDVQIRHRTS